MQQTNDTVTLDDVWRLFRETDERLDKRFQESDRKFQEAKEEILRSSKETDERFKETFQLIKETRKAIGDLGNRLGQFVEEMVMPSALRLLQERGIKVYEMYPRAQSKRFNKRGIEIDLLLVNSTDVVAIEVKSALNMKYVDDHIRKLGEFKTYFPHYKDFNLYGAVAGMVVPSEVATYAVEQGLFAFTPTDSSMLIANADDFKPKIW